jgi:hypothetical protein
MLNMDARRVANDSARKRPARPVLVAVGFLIAFAATVATVILTGLWVRAPRSEERPAAPAAASESPRQRSSDDRAAADDAADGQEREEARDERDDPAAPR